MHGQERGSERCNRPGELMKTWSAVVMMVSAALVSAPDAQQMVDWPHWGGDAAQTKYSAASEIVPANVRDLELAWTWQTIDRAMPEHDLRPGEHGVHVLRIDPEQRSRLG